MNTTTFNHATTAAEFDRLNHNPICLEALDRLAERAIDHSLENGLTADACNNLTHAMFFSVCDEIKRNANFTLIDLCFAAELGLASWAFGDEFLTFT